MGLKHWSLAAWALTVAACVTPTGPAPRPLPLPGETPVPGPTPTPTPTPSPTPSPTATASPTGRTVYGLVSLRTVRNDYFHTNRGFRLLSVAIGGAPVVFTTLEQAALRFGGDAVVATTDDDGRFAVVGRIPADAAFVATASLAGGHRLSAVALPESRDLTLDEAGSMIAEMARWQVPTNPTAGVVAHALHDWSTQTMQSLYQRTLALVRPGDFEPAGTPPVIEPLQAGAGLKLRHRYVATFGSQVTATGTTDADALSDAWRTVLGYRPLAITVVAGGGPGNDDVPGPDAALAGPTDAVADAAGNVWIVEHDAGTLRVVAAASRDPWLERATNLTAGRIYTLLGSPDGPIDRASFEALYRPLEASAVATPQTAPYALDPATRAPFPLFAPRRIALEPGPGDVPTIYLASDDGNRVLWLPAVDQARFGRRVLAGRVYTLAGTGDEATDADPATGDGGPASAARLSHPAAIARDSRGDVFILDAGVVGGSHHGTVRLVRAGDGKIVGLPLTRNGQTLRMPGASDMRLVESPTGNALYVADPSRNVVWRAALPADLGTLANDPIGAIAVNAVLGDPDSAPAAASPVPDLFSVNTVVPKASAGLLAPTALGFDGSGDLLAADGDPGRLRLLESSGLAGTGGVWTIGGAFLTPPGAAGSADVLAGDARLAGFPGTVAMALEADGNLLVTDRRANVVRRLWLRRGAL